MIKKVIVALILICILAGLYLLYTPVQRNTNLKKVVVMVPFIAQPQWIPYYTASYKGYYAEEGLDVEIQYSTRGSAGPLEQLAAGKVDFILTDTSSLIIGQTQGVDAVAIYSIEPVNIFYILSEKDKNITKPLDLVGKKVGVISAASSAYTNLQAILSLSGLSINDVEVIYAGTAITASFLENQFDAASVHLSQKVLIENEIPDINVIKASDYTNMTTGHLVTARQYTQNDPETVRKFLRATKRGLEYAVNNQEEAVDIYIALNPDAESKREISLAFWKEFINENNYEQGLPGEESESHWKEAQDTAYEVGLIGNKMDVSLFYTNNFNT